MKTAFAEVDARAARLSAAFEGVAVAMSSHHAGVTGAGVLHVPATGPDLRHSGVRVFQYACRWSFPARPGGHPSRANDNLVTFAGLALTGYSVTSGAPSAILRR
ncbi:hypothetical protein HGP16_16040 [Rhizobium sp. P40RR-XXII]|uniref:hypothetical protein n=1 Tax=unclassified Rhizobium TaxID=2613769 RepID=UPI001457116B|nr:MULTISPECIES: hypothetical protein [unclassified Rhizobium]NLR86906.1 hypothetical protein [Rhizobium sp. P28RR-XV]NLS18073.1 hypothetical protein [Rhizobium sp. P40RR-XXII]